MNDLRAEHERWLGEQERKAAIKENPCIRVYGQGPDGEVCRDCKLLIVRVFAKNYYKCTLRTQTRGPGTDHRVHWPACGRFQKG